MSRSHLAKSDSKAAMVKQLGLTDPIYQLLLKEAEAGRDRLSYDRNNLTTYSQNQKHAPVVPYRWDELQETKIHNEVLRIIHTAGHLTHPYYQTGRYIDGQVEENWVARWFLWHSFRYRDNRVRTAAEQAAEQAAVMVSTGKSQYWDPVSGTYR